MNFVCPEGDDDMDTKSNENAMHERLGRIDEVIANGRYKDTWESLQQ